MKLRRPSKWAERLRDRQRAYDETSIAAKRSTARPGSQNPHKGGGPSRRRAR